jgi:hypothetical protein
MSWSHRNGVGYNGEGFHEDGSLFSILSLIFSLSPSLSTSLCEITSQLSCSIHLYYSLCHLSLTLDKPNSNCRETLIQTMSPTTTLQLFPSSNPYKNEPKRKGSRQYPVKPQSPEPIVEEVIKQPTMAPKLLSSKSSKITEPLLHFQAHQKLM